MNLLYIYGFYLGFALSVSIYRQWVKGTFNLLNKIAFAPILLSFFLLDVVLNYTLFLILCGIPPKHCYTISDRLAFYKHSQDTSWNKTLASFICDKLLNPVDPTGQHC